MRKWDTEIFRNNHVRLMKRHFGLAIVYLLICWTVASLGDFLVGSLILFGTPALIHLILAYGSHRKVELSRKVSVFIFVLLAIGTAPIGTIVAIFWLIPTTIWAAPENF